MTAVGTANPMAQGQAMISTVTAATKAWRYAGDGPKSNQMTNVAIAIEITTGTKTAEIRSASRWIGALLPWACCTSRMIRDSTVSPPTRSTRRRSAPFRLRVAPMSGSPGLLETGTGSPVSMDSSTWLSPSSTTPSAGTVAPGRTSTSSPGRSAASGTSSSRPSRISQAVAGRSPIRRRMALVVWPLARASSRLPRRTSATIQTTASK